MSGKWLELLKEIAPGMTRVGVLRDSAVAAGIGQFGALQTAAPPFGIVLSPIDVGEPSDIERGITTFAGTPNSGLVATASARIRLHYKLIITLAAKYRLPAIYADRFFVTEGGLISYAPDRVDQYRRTAGYVDRIFKGEKAADLPVQAPTKYELVVNLKTAKALSITIPQSLLASADEVIE
jgi:putative tryptophan/tyrosine transport system substrate-binding protein